VLTIFPAMLLMGAAFPIGLHVWTGGADPSAAARRIGVFYAVNVCGSILGSVTAGFILLPAIGSRNTVLLLAAITGCCALALLVVANGPGPRRLALAAGGVALLVLAPVPDPFRVFLAQRFPDWPIVWQEEGVQTTVSVHRVGTQRAMYLDGLHQASTAGSMSRTHWRIGHLGMMLHPQAADVLVVGLGGGATAGAVSRYPFARTHIVELSSAVVSGAAYFTDINYGVLTRPNVTLRVDDGRSHLALSGRKYDVITADIIQPVHAGAANVYAAEYFRLVRGALRPGGLAVQWVFGTDAEYRMIMRTFLSVFPHATLWADGSVMVAGLGPLKVSRADVAWKLNVPEVAAALHDAGIESTADLLGLYTAGPAAMRRFAGPGPILTDDRPVLEYFLSLPREPLELRGLSGSVTEIFGQ
jgi:spermidine synthase